MVYSIKGGGHRNSYFGIVVTFCHKNQSFSKKQEFKAFRLEFADYSLAIQLADILIFISVSTHFQVHIAYFEEEQELYSHHSPRLSLGDKKINIKCPITTLEALLPLYRVLSGHFLVLVVSRQDSDTNITQTNSQSSKANKLKFFEIFESKINILVYLLL